MMIQLMQLEERISANYRYLKEIHPEIEDLLAQIRTILDYGMCSEDINAWWKRNTHFIMQVKDLLDNKIDT